jgi:protein-S-isoprenylcysteine O-methyltransferase Ste14
MASMLLVPIRLLEVASAMVALKPPPTIRRLSKILVAGVVGFVASPGTLTATTATVVSTQSTSHLLTPGPYAVVVTLTIALAAAVAAVAYYTTQS